MSAIRVVPQSFMTFVSLSRDKGLFCKIAVCDQNDVKNFQEENDGIKRFRDTCKRFARRGR